MFAGKKSAQIREILINESAWEEMTCLFAPSLTHYGSITVFIVLGVMLLLCALVLSIFGIETRKVSLEEISEVN
ncbi:hypothetical protein C5Y85_18730 [Escherichia coli]|nr:hypothetical protein C5Y85_18730 [Escherichia coli]